MTRLSVVDQSMSPISLGWLGVTNRALFHVLFKEVGVNAMTEPALISVFRVFKVDILGAIKEKIASVFS